MAKSLQSGKAQSTVTRMKLSVEDGDLLGMGVIMTIGNGRNDLRFKLSWAAARFIGDTLIQFVNATSCETKGIRIDCLNR